MANRKTTVLVVEDDIAVRNLVTTALGSHGYDRLTAVTGEEAVRAIAASLPDIVLLDLGLPDIDGVDVMKLSDTKRSAFRNKHMGFVFQFHQLLPEFTALENIMMPALIGGTSRREAKRRAEELLAFMALSERASHKPSELSGGEKQRVAVARALVNKPDVVFADEPSGSLDTQNKQELHRLFFDLRDQMGQTFVIVTHDEQLADLADRKICMQDGRIVD